MRRKGSARSSRSARPCSRGSDTPSTTRRSSRRATPGRAVRIRRARAGDVPAVVELWRDLIAYHRQIGETDMPSDSNATRGGRAFIRNHIGRRTRVCLIAEMDGTPVGFLVAALRKRPPEFGEYRYGYILDAYVAEPHRDQGVGAKLVSEILPWFRAKHVHRVQLQVRTRNTLGIRFWERLGFEPLALTMAKRI